MEQSSNNSEKPGATPSYFFPHEVETLQRFRRHQRIKFILCALAFWTIVRGAGDLDYCIAQYKPLWLEPVGSRDRWTYANKAATTSAGYFSIALMAWRFADQSWPTSREQRPLLNILHESVPPTELAKLRVTTTIMTGLGYISFWDNSIFEAIVLPITWSIFFIVGSDTPVPLEKVLDCAANLGKFLMLTALTWKMTGMVFEENYDPQERREAGILARGP